MKSKPTPRFALRRHNTHTGAAAACLSLAIILAILTAAQAQAAEFHPLGFAFSINPVPNYVTVSEDGSVVVGSSLENRLIRWTRETGPKLLGPELNPLDDMDVISLGRCLCGDFRVMLARRWVRS